METKAILKITKDDIYKFNLYIFDKKGEIK